MKEKILILEDEIGIRSFVSINLKREGYEVIEAGCGQEAIDKIKNDSNKTIVIIEHRLEDVLYRNVDRVIVVNNGEIVKDTTPRELLATEVLKECGIREPLYITALKYAGCKLG